MDRRRPRHGRLDEDRTPDSRRRRRLISRTKDPVRAAIDRPGPVVQNRSPGSESGAEDLVWRNGRPGPVVQNRSPGSESGAEDLALRNGRPRTRCSEPKPRFGKRRRGPRVAQRQTSDPSFRTEAPVRKAAPEALRFPHSVRSVDPHVDAGHFDAGHRRQALPDRVREERDLRGPRRLVDFQDEHAVVEAQRSRGEPRPGPRPLPPNGRTHHRLRAGRVRAVSARPRRARP